MNLEINTKNKEKERNLKKLIDINSIQIGDIIEVVDKKSKEIIYILKITNNHIVDYSDNIQCNVQYLYNKNTPHRKNGYTIWRFKTPESRTPYLYYENSFFKSKLGKLLKSYE